MSEEISSSQTDTSSEAVATETTTEATTLDVEGQPQNTTSYLDGKYDSVSALETGYKELQSTFSKKTAEYNKALGGLTGAPETYELAEGIEVSEGMMEYARENNFSNEALNNLAMAYQANQEAEREVYVAEQKELLGKDGQQRIQNVIDWGKANLGEDALPVLDKMIDSAAGIEVFEKIAKISQGTAAAQVATPKTTYDRDSLRQMRFANDEFGNRRMSADPQYRAKVEAMESEFVNNGGKL